ncbi:hypothetical protein [Dysgonomonas sp. Marseille-P4361]|uniref:hypothetical protein n=1 Tax=Dysgonomonas sp. Marseille-P4361 TaxID=2161820 RepID=UPI001358AD7B|nr:hypothetical protein [Dysgonomonas sp. Marseille-P4361]
MKKLSLLLLLPFFMLLSCSDDNSESPDNTNPVLSLSNEQIAGTYTLSKAIDKNGNPISYDCNFSKITYELKTDGSALHKRCSQDFDHTWKRDKDKITIHGEGIIGDGTTYSLQINSTNKKLELVTAYTVYIKN